MFAGVATFQGPPERLGEGVEQRFQEQVLPMFRQQTGFQRALVLLDRAGGKLVGISL
jgi:hypothetical protein